MIDIPFQVLIADYFSHSILLVDIPTGEVLCEIPYPEAVKPAAIVLTEDKKTAYIPCVKNGGHGVLFALSLETLSLYELPLELPHPGLFSLSPGNRVYLTDAASTLYSLNLTTMELTAWGQMPEDASCTGIAASAQRIYTVWEHSAGGTLAIFNRQGELIRQQPFAGTPTSLTLMKDGKLIVPFTASPYTGEGLILFTEQNNGSVCSDIITLLCPFCAKGVRAYPLQAVLSPDDKTLYIVNEDSSSITVVNLSMSIVEGCIPVGRSLSQICLSTDGRFAIGASNRFADLSMIDLVNQRLLSLTNTPRELSGFIVSLQ